MTKMVELVEPSLMIAEIDTLLFWLPTFQLGIEVRGGQVQMRQKNIL